MAAPVVPPAAAGAGVAVAPAATGGGVRTSCCAVAHVGTQFSCFWELVSAAFKDTTAVITAVRKATRIERFIISRPFTHRTLITPPHAGLPGLQARSARVGSLARPFARSCSICNQL